MHVHEAEAVEMVFFDIGGTLGERDPATGRLTPYETSAKLLDDVRRSVGLRIGIITTLGPTLTDADALALLDEAGLAAFLDPKGFVSDHGAGAAKPSAAIYRFAARRAGVAPSRCLYVGEDLAEVLGALAAGMQAVLTPRVPA
ncbi:MAG: HAD family hydrolase [Gemmatimonadaceae bacterium]